MKIERINCHEGRRAYFSDIAAGFPVTRITRDSVDLLEKHVIKRICGAIIDACRLVIDGGQTNNLEFLYYWIYHFSYALAKRANNS